MVCVQFIRWGFGQSIGSELMIAMMLMTMVTNTWDRRDTCCFAKNVIDDDDGSDSEIDVDDDGGKYLRQRRHVPLC